MKLLPGALLGRLEPQTSKARAKLDLIEEKKQRLDLGTWTERCLIYDLHGSFMKKCSRFFRAWKCCTFTHLKIKILVTHSSSAVTNHRRWWHHTHSSNGSLFLSNISVMWCWALQKLFLSDDSDVLIDHTWNENCQFLLGSTLFSPANVDFLSSMFL